MTLQETYNESREADTGLAFQMDYFADVSAWPACVASTYLKEQGYDFPDGEVNDFIYNLRDAREAMAKAGN